MVDAVVGWITSAPVSVRETIIRALLNAIATATDQNSNPVFQTVVRGDPNDLPAAAMPACGLEFGDDDMTPLTYLVEDHTLTVYASFQATRLTDVDNYAQYEYYLAQLKRATTGNVHLGGATNIQERMATNENAGQSDPRPSGILTLTVRYRHVKGDPFTKA